MKVEPADNIDTLGLSEECLDILRQAGVETLRQFVEVEWRDVATVCGTTPGKLYAILRARDQIRPSLGFSEKQSIPVRREPVRSVPTSESKMRGRDLQVHESSPQTLELERQPTQELSDFTLSSLGLGVR